MNSIDILLNLNLLSNRNRKHDQYVPLRRPRPGPHPKHHLHRRLPPLQFRTRRQLHSRLQRQRNSQPIQHPKNTITHRQQHLRPGRRQRHQPVLQIQPRPSDQIYNLLQVQRIFSTPDPHGLQQGRIHGGIGETGHRIVDL